MRSEPIRAFPFNEVSDEYLFFFSFHLFVFFLFCNWTCLVLFLLLLHFVLHNTQYEYKELSREQGVMVVDLVTVV